jgi:glycosyltransferase involved in cell wall biosynthesis
MPPIKTILLLQDLLCGGTQRHTLELAKRLDPGLFDPEIWTLAAGDDFLPLARQYGLRVRMLSASSRVTPWALAALWRALKRQAPELLMALTVVPNIWGRVLGRLTRTPVVVANCRGGDDLWRQHEAGLKHPAHHHICNSEALKAALTGRYGLPDSRVSVIPTGVDTAFFTPPTAAPAPGPVILCLARLAAVKDHATLVAAFEQAAPGHPGARLRLVGDGELRGRLAERIARSPVRERIDLLPGSPDPRRHYAEASLVALASVNEGMPNVLLEAMAMGLPTVATAVGGTPEAVRHGVSGLLVPAGDAQALGAALSRLLGDGELRRRMGLAGRTIALSEHSLEAVAMRHSDLLTELVKRRRAGR